MIKYGFMCDKLNDVSPIEVCDRDKFKKQQKNIILISPN